jgi:hypothetical protein
VQARREGLSFAVFSNGLVARGELKGYHRILSGSVDREEQLGFIPARVGALMPNKSEKISVKIFVYRRLDNRSEGLPDDSPRALELHNLRKEGMHEALAGIAGIEVDWGTVDDSKSHELAHSIVTFISDPQIHATVSHAASWAALKALEAAIGWGTVEMIKKMIEKMRPKQKEGKIVNFWFNLPTHTSVFVSREGEIAVGPTPEDIRED